MQNDHLVTVKAGAGESLKKHFLGFQVIF